jgi:hypothetical protein
MGMDQKVTFTGRTPPGWADVAGLLASRGWAVQMRMIDGQLAFPDEVPSEDWKELRVGVPGGMVTIRRQPDEVLLVTWGNADRAGRELWNALAWAWAAAGQGLVQTPEGPVDAASFAAKAEMPA